MVAVFALISCNYLAGARVLMRSVAQHLPHARRVVFLTDEPTGRFEPKQEDFEVLSATVTDLPRYRHAAFALTPAELCYALKPFCAKFLLERDAPETLIFLDADTLLLAPPHDIVEQSRTHGVSLTPHLIDAARNALTALPTMRSAVFNAGIFAVTPSPLAIAFLTWWSRQLANPSNLSPDWMWEQGWLALTPGLFPGYGLLRHPGYNVAFWNLHERDITSTPEGTLLANGLPLTLFHFSYFTPDLPDRLTGRMQTNFPGPNDVVRGLLARYAASLLASGHAECRRWSYGYGTFADGRPITPTHRRYFKERLLSDISATADPFDPALRVAGYRGLKSLYRADHFIPRTARALRAAQRLFGS